MSEDASTRRMVVIIDVTVRGIDQQDDEPWRIVRHALWDAWDGSTNGNVRLDVCSIHEPQGEPAP